ncbi:MAG: VIT1/CCC1 transporter family protein [Promethearchaeota archaeon]
MKHSEDDDESIYSNEEEDSKESIVDGGLQEDDGDQVVDDGFQEDGGDQVIDGGLQEDDGDQVVDDDEGRQTDNESEHKFSALKKIAERWKLYSKISNLGLVARRFFVKNMTDGILTTLGVVIGFFVLYLSDPAQISDNMIIILPGIGTAVAMCVSGVLASFLTETAERRKALLELKQEMVMFEGEDDEVEGDKKHKKKTLKERAEKFAAIVASLIDGFSPFLAALVVLIPFYFPGEPQIWEFIMSIILTCTLLFLLGTYLAHLSQMNYVVYGLKMVAMGLLTLIITYLLGQF